MIIPAKFRENFDEKEPLLMKFLRNFANPKRSLKIREIIGKAANFGYGAV